MWAYLTPDVASPHGLQPAPDVVARFSVTFTDVGARAWPDVGGAL
ncbi:hypothetical protein J2S49_000675 [Arcanobacterium wilhelmae]|uniref:Uncharacterized protein n=1 Tax=Arcanobacterium wilhelmae TaxID=1803177 RepID=A0ABT9NA60_9ACTO|nr:hypothetical protein [Arcanobacterium wilhelmae]MDP9800599.1 hypothetical protein [Arcanobacterium wilhelmae]WFN90008.1 hypothetical protein P8A24_07385 [Arcanobacterium wilhelmae]